MTDTAPRAHLDAAIRPSPNGTTRIIFTLTQPGNPGSYAGELTVDTTDVKLLPLFAQLFTNWASQHQSSVQVAPADALDKLQKINGHAANH